jgi:hypothetical protein
MQRAVSVLPLPEGRSSWQKISCTPHSKFFVTQVKFVIYGMCVKTILKVFSG